jgi:uncharacterized protein
MPIEIGTIEALFRYPVKSMRGERLEAATLGWHGIEGDRRFALRRLQERGDFPWLTASKLPEMLLFTPNASSPPTHVRTPEGRELPIFGEELAAEVAGRHGSPVEMMQIKHGIFDDGIISLITSTTVGEICRLAGERADARRFRPNILVRSTREVAFMEDEWLGGVITFGNGDAPGLTVTMRDERCAMINYDPDDVTTAPALMKAVVHANRSHAGIYATVARLGRLQVGQRVVLHP